MNKWKKNVDEVIAIVPTYNRKHLLLKCVDSLLGQSHSIKRIIIVDNASTDGTRDILSSNKYFNNENIQYIRLDENSGGAGGFFTGIKTASSQDYDWLWLMDDDALPDITALEKLLEVDPDRSNIYSSVAINADHGRQELCWPAVRPGRSNAFYLEELGEMQQVLNIPFLGFLIHRDLVKRIGLPEKEFFILGDDMEYTERARLNGSQLYLVGNSIIRHPMPKRHIFRFMGRKFYNLVLPPWKKYYDVRNRVLISRKYYGIRCWTQTIPGLVVRMIDSLLHEPDKKQVFHAYAKGIVDGLMKRQGRRVLPDQW